MSGAAGAHRSTRVDRPAGDSVSAPAPYGGEWPLEASPSIAEVALKALCPRCGRRTLYAGYIRFAESCTYCGLDFTRFNVGDGPAAFLTLIIGTIIVALAIWLEVAASPPFWVHILIWLPLTVAGVMASLRFAKAALIGIEYRNQAREGRVDKREP